MCVSSLVRTSAVCLGSRHSSMVRMSLLTRSWIMCHQIVMCLECWWNCGFRAMAIDPLLSPLMSVGPSCGYPNSLYRFLSQNALCTAFARATYSALVEESVTVVCFLDRHVIAPPEALKTYPDVDLKLSWFANTASVKPWKWLRLLVVFEGDLE